MKTVKNTSTIKQPNFLLLILFTMLCCILFHQTSMAQSCTPAIGDFTSVNPNARGETLQLPATHTFQKIIQNGEKFSNGETFYYNADFAGYVPINNSNINGYLSINNESQIGGAAVLDINFDENDKLWSVSNAVNVDFSSVGGTSRNCSGAVTPWGTIISSEEVSNSCDNSNVLKQYGWQVEIDPTSKTVIGKRYAMGNFAHENAAILQQGNRTVVYQGADQNDGYLFKFVSFQQNDLSNGDLYVYKGTKNAGTGSWIKINNQTNKDRNCTIQLALEKQATVFKSIEDVEIAPNGLIYFAVKNEHRVYYFEDTNPLGLGQVNFKGTYVGGDVETQTTTAKKYPIKLSNGTTVNEPWGSGNDNLAFDNEGNLWVFQDGGEDHIWLVKNDHTQNNPKVAIFATTPLGSEPTGITFSPDNRFMFMSIQHPGRNSKTLIDAADKIIRFNEDITLVIARKEHLGNNDVVVGCMDNNACNFNASATIEDCLCTYPEPNFDCDGNCLAAYDCNYECGGPTTSGFPCSDGKPWTVNDALNNDCECVGEWICYPDISIYSNYSNSGYHEYLLNTYESSKLISTEAYDDYVRVGIDQTVNLKSEHIILNAGFSVPAGGCLNAEIEPCEE